MPADAYLEGEVSLPTGSICAERAAIANVAITVTRCHKVVPFSYSQASAMRCYAFEARTLYPGIMRKQMKADTSVSWGRAGPGRAVSCEPKCYSIQCQGIAVLDVPATVAVLLAL